MLVTVLHHRLGLNRAAAKMRARIRLLQRALGMRLVMVLVRAVTWKLPLVTVPVMGMQPVSVLSNLSATTLVTVGNPFASFVLLRLVRASVTAPLNAHVEKAHCRAIQICFRDDSTFVKVNRSSSLCFGWTVSFFFVG